MRLVLYRFAFGVVAMGAATNVYYAIHFSLWPGTLSVLFGAAQIAWCLWSWPSVRPASAT